MEDIYSYTVVIVQCTARTCFIYSHLATESMPNLSLSELRASLPTACGLWSNKLHLCFCESGVVPASEFNVGAVINMETSLACTWRDTGYHGPTYIFRQLPYLGLRLIGWKGPCVLGQTEKVRCKPERPRFLSALISLGCYNWQAKAGTLKGRHFFFFV